VTDALGTPPPIVLHGGESEIGRAIVRALGRGRHDARVVLVGRPNERWAEAAADLVYGSATAGTGAFCLGLADLAPDGVNVTVVRPGFVRTRMTAGRTAAPLASMADEVGEVVASTARQARVVYAPRVLRWAMLLLRSFPQANFRRLPE
jgi:decaprenylphospho-beta-D-erythro-pentofuranosid-2-ulose 2-reductase